MPRIRHVLIGLAVLPVLLLLAAWQIPGWLNWTRYRATLEVLASATLAQPVTIEGPIALTLLPQPVLTAAQVNIGGGDDDGLAIHVDALRLRVALWPLLSGHVDARELVLRGPDLRIAWPAQAEMLRLRPPNWLAPFSARIEAGKLAIGRLLFTGVDGNLATSETGALTATGTAKFNDKDWSFTARLTSAGPDGSAGVNVTLDGQGKAAGLGGSFSGQLAADGTLAGGVAARGPDLSVLLPAPAVPFRADGRLTVGSGLLAADQLALEIGGSPATAAVALRVAPQQRLDVALAASRLDLDAWMPVLLQRGTKIAGLNLPVGLDLSAEAAPLGGGTLQHLRAAFEFLGNDVLVREASVVLPGDAALLVAGRLARGEPARPQFSGEARLNAPVLRTTLRWFEDAMPSLLPGASVANAPSGTLQQAALAARVEIGAGSLQAHDLSGQIDGTPIAGQFGLRRSEPRAITAELTVQHPRLDPFLPTHWPVWADIGSMVPNVDVDLRLHLLDALVANESIKDATADIGIGSGLLTLRRLDVSADAGRLSASGVLNRSGRLSDGVLTLAVDDAARLADFLPSAWRATPALWQGPARGDLTAAGPTDALSLRLSLAMADARLEAQPVIDLRSGAWSGSVMLRHPGAPRLVATLGLPAIVGLPNLPAWLGDGSLSLMAQASGGPGVITLNSFDLTAAMLRTSGKLALTTGPNEPRLTGKLTVETMPIPSPSALSTAPLPLGMLRGWHADLHVEVERLLADFRPVLRNVSAAIDLTNGVLRIDLFNGRIGGGVLTGSLQFDSTPAPPALTVQLQLKDATIAGPLDDAPLDLLSGHIEASMDASASGFSPSAVLATLAGHASATITDGVLAGFDLFQVKRAALTADRAVAASAMSSGATGFDRLDLAGHFSHGDFSLDDTRLAATAGNADFTGGCQLASQLCDLRIAVHPAIPDSPEIALRLSGPAEQPSRTLELSGLSRWLAEHGP